MELITRHLCLASDIGVHGNLFGGKLLSWLDISASLFTSKITGSPHMVTVKMEEVVFKKAVKEGQTIQIYGEVMRIGRTSITVRMKATNYNVYSQNEVDVCTTLMTFVQIDEQGDPIPINESVKARFAPQS